MKTQFTLFAALALIVNTSPVFAQSTTDSLRTDSVTSVARTFGDGAGHIVMTDASGSSKIMAIGESSYAVYTAGDGITTMDTYVFCIEDRAGGLSSCTPPGSSAYYCETDCAGGYCDGWCECSDVLDCVALAFSGNCTAPLDCDNSGCACTNH